MSSKTKTKGETKPKAEPKTKPKTKKETKTKLLSLVCKRAGLMRAPFRV